MSTITIPTSMPASSDVAAAVSHPAVHLSSSATGSCGLLERQVSHLEAVITNEAEETWSNTKTANGTNGSTLPHVRSISGVVDFHQREAEGLMEERNDEEEHPLSYETTKTILKEPSSTCSTTIINACSARQGARVVFATDEWFASADRLLNDETEPFFDPQEYCEQGKVMDGWETRRRRDPGHDWCIIRLAQRTQFIGGMPAAVTVDTSYFTGNQAPAISIEIIDIPDLEEEIAWISQFPGVWKRFLLHGQPDSMRGTGMSREQVELAETLCKQPQKPWRTVLPKTPLRPGYPDTCFHEFTIPNSVTGTHIRLNYYPDGGVARLRLMGQPVLETSTSRTPPFHVDPSTMHKCTIVPHEMHRRRSGGQIVLPSQQLLLQPSDEYKDPEEVSCADLGGLGVSCTNHHYGNPNLLLQSSYGIDMGDGWETARNPRRPSILVKDPQTGLVDSPLSDHCIIKLGRPVPQVKCIVLDTQHFRGNYPESVQVDGCYLADIDQEDDEDGNKGHFDEDAVTWFPLIPRCRMAPDSEHLFEACKGQILTTVPESSMVSHVRVTIFPDGGLSRVRVYG
jgi:allantoicase